jgi:hypothetical protein
MNDKILKTEAMAVLFVLFPPELPRLFVTLSCSNSDDDDDNNNNNNVVYMSGSCPICHDYHCAVVL